MEIKTCDKKDIFPTHVSFYEIVKNKMCHTNTNTHITYIDVRWPSRTHASQMIEEWEQYRDRAGSIMESGCFESQPPKNSLNMCSTASEGGYYGGKQILM